MAPLVAKTTAGANILRGIDTTLTSPMERVQQFLSNVGTEGFDADTLTNHLRLTSATATGRVTFAYTVPPGHCNRMGNLHGGAAALLFDICTTAALAPVARAGHWAFAGVSRGLSVTYLRPAPLGTAVEVVGEVVAAGKRLATLRGEIWAAGKLLMVAEHLKVTIDPVEKL